MIAAPERIRVNCDLRHVNVVLCCDPKAFTHTNPLDGMAEGGCLVWESDEEGEAGVGAAAAVGAQADHRQEHPRLHAARLQDRAQSDRPRRPAAPHAGQRVPRRVLLASRRCSQEFGITPEQFRDAVHKQYVKKFGKLGDAVVTSNMEVMTKGFELVREIKIGELEAADRSTLRGKALLPMVDAGEHRASEGLRHRAAARIPPPEGQPAAHAADARRRVRRDVPGEAWLQPAGQRLRVARHHGGRQRRHGVEVRRAPRDAALHSGKLHAVHGVHRGLSGHGAAELLAGSRHDSARRRSPTTSPTPASGRRCSSCCRRSRSGRAS